MRGVSTTWAVRCRLRALCAWAACLGFAWLAAPAAAEQPADASASFAADIRPFLVEHCTACHGEHAQEGGLRLDQLSADLTQREAARHWIEVMDRLNLGEMPPPDEPRPEVEQVRTVTAWIASELRQAERKSLSSGGRVLLRRMNRTEYANTIRDLLAMPFLPGEGPLALLPPDGSAEGFDKVSAALMLDPSLLDKYYQVAVLVAERAMVDGPPEFPTEKLRFEFEDTRKSRAINYLCSQPGFRCRENDVELMQGGTRSYDVLKYPGTRRHIATKGLYRVRIRASALSGADGEPIVMLVQQNHPEASQELIMRVTVTATPDAPQVFETVIARDPQGGEWNVRMEKESTFMLYDPAGGSVDRAVNQAGEAGDFATVMRLRGRMQAEGLSRTRPNPQTVDRTKLPRLYLDWIEVEGPLYESWPPPSHQLLLHRGENAEPSEAYLREIFLRLLPRAWRRPVDEAEAEPIIQLALRKWNEGADFQDAVRLGLIATLTSPKFIYLREQSSTEQSSTAQSNSGRRDLDAYELACRLSYYLWSSMPDDQLFARAADGSLLREQVLLEQVDRMLADPKSEALVEGFARQWLRTDDFRNFTPDGRMYREYNETLGKAMVEEPLAFFREVLREELPITSFLHAEWTMLNEPLARFYGLEQVAGNEFRRVALPDDSHRGGILGMAGVAMLGSDGTRTKPVTRGVYVREVLFNDPPDPPPPNVGEVEPNIRGENLTVRDRLIQHQQIETCAACHRTIDPYGLALENFNVIGQWRERQDGENFRGNNRPEIDASGKLPGGEAFDGFEQFRQLLAGQHHRFRRALIEKMMIYALGRPLEPTDRATVEQIAADMQQEGDTLRQLIRGVATTTAFRTK